MRGGSDKAVAGLIINSAVSTMEETRDCVKWRRRSRANSINQSVSERSEGVNKARNYGRIARLEGIGGTLLFFLQRMIQYFVLAGSDHK